MTYDYTSAKPAQPQAQQGDTVAFGGRLTKDIELFTTNNGNTGVNIDFAMDSIKHGTLFGRVTYWGAKAQMAVDFLRKGMPISGTGKRYMSYYTKNDGTQGSQLTYDGLTLNFDVEEVAALIVRIVDAKLESLGTPKDTPEVEDTAVAEQPTQPAQQPVQPKVEPQPAPTIDLDSSDLPF